MPVKLTPLCLRSVAGGSLRKAINQLYTTKQ